MAMTLQVVRARGCGALATSQRRGRGRGAPRSRQLAWPLARRGGVAAWAGSQYEDLEYESEEDEEGEGDEDFITASDLMYDEEDDEEDLELVEEEEEEEEEEEMPSVEELDKMFGIEQHVIVDEAVKGLPEKGRRGIPRVVMHHSDGSALEVFLHGANVTSWVLPNGGDVLFLIPSSSFDGSEAIQGGIPISFPQVGPGGEFPGSVPYGEELPLDGFVKDMDWRIASTQVTEGPYGEAEPCVTLRARDNQETRRLWPFRFELYYTVQLARRGLACELTVLNRSDERMVFCAGMMNHIGVTDALKREVNAHGLGGTNYFDNVSGDSKPRARVDKGPITWLEGRTERVYVQTMPEVGLEVGSGCTVWAQNLMGFEDHVLSNPGDFNHSRFFREYVGLGCARAGRPVKLDPGQSWHACQMLDVEDKVYTPDMMYWDKPKRKPLPPYIRPEDLQLRVPEDPGFFQRDYLDWWQG